MTDHLPEPDSPNEPADQWSAIARFLCGECSAAEAHELRQWLAAHPGHADTIALLDGMLPPVAINVFNLNRDVADSASMTPADIENALRSVRSRMQSERVKASAPTLQLSRSAASDAAFAAPAHPSVRVLHNRNGVARTITALPPARHNSGRWRVAGLVAAAAALAAFGLNSWRSTRLPAATVAITYESKVGAQDSIMLPDSSRVVLAPGSRLVVAANYGQGQRNVELQGGGQFTVRHDASRPFALRIGSAVIKDLGTTFLVRSNARQDVVVSVMEGSVSLSDTTSEGGSQPVELKAGDRGLLQVNGSPVAQLGVVTSDEAAWVTGKLVYRDAPLAEVQADLRRWYGVELVIPDVALAHESITTDGWASQPVERLLERIALMKGAKAVRHGDTAFIERSGDRLKH